MLVLKITDKQGNLVFARTFEDPITSVCWDVGRECDGIKTITVTNIQDDDLDFPAYNILQSHDPYMQDKRTMRFGKWTDSCQDCAYCGGGPSKRLDRQLDMAKQAGNMWWDTLNKSIYCDPECASLSRKIHI